MNINYQITKFFQLQPQKCPFLDEIHAADPHIECLFFLHFRNEVVRKSTKPLKRQKKQVFASTNFLSQLSGILSHVKISHSTVKFKALLPTSRKTFKRLSVPRLFNVFNCFNNSCFQLVSVFGPTFSKSATLEKLFYLNCFFT